MDDDKPAHDYETALYRVSVTRSDTIQCGDVFCKPCKHAEWDRRRSTHWYCTFFKTEIPRSRATLQPVRCRQCLSGAKRKGKQ